MTGRAGYNTAVMLSRPLIFAGVLLAAFGFCGCAPRDASPTERTSFPAAGKVRVLFTKVAEGNGKTHVKWTVLGGVNWRDVAAGGDAVTLSQTYPLNATGVSGGCNTWEIDLKTEPDGAGKVRWKLIGHGSNGATATSGGTDSGDLRILLDHDTETGLPAKIPLAEIAGRTMELRAQQ